MYKTNDIGLVSALACNKIEPRETVMEGSKVYFCYDDTDTFEQVSDDYYSGRLMVDAQEIMLKLKSTKQSMFAKLDRQEATR